MSLWPYDDVIVWMIMDNARDQSVRLIGGNHSREGIVEITYGGRWGMVCNNDFGLIDAQIICKGLGFGNDGVTVISTRYVHHCNSGECIISGWTSVLYKNISLVS